VVLAQSASHEYNTAASAETLEPPSARSVARITTPAREMMRHALNRFNRLLARFRVLPASSPPVAAPPRLSGGRYVQRWWFSTHGVQGSRRCPVELKEPNRAKPAERRKQQAMFARQHYNQHAARPPPAASAANPPERHVPFGRHQQRCEAEREHSRRSFCRAGIAKAAQRPRSVSCRGNGRIYGGTMVPQVLRSGEPGTLRKERHRGDRDTRYVTEYHHASVLNQRPNPREGNTTTSEKKRHTWLR